VFSGMITVFDFLLLHLTLTAVYAFFRLTRKHILAQTVCETAIVLFLPGFGLLFMTVFHLAQDPSRDPSYVYKDFTDDKVLLKEFSLQEADVLPVQDALMLEDNTTKRTLLLDAIKRDVLKNDELLLKAVHDQDTEVSHYAVSIMTTKIQAMEDSFYELGQKLAADPHDLAALKQYADTMSDYLKIGFLDQISQKKFEKEYAGLLARLLAVDQSCEKYFLAKIDCEIGLGHFAEAEKYCGLFMKHYSLREEPYLQYIKLYHHLRDTKKTGEYIKMLKDTNIKFTKNALNMVRFFTPDKTG
jgi:hypothetical protein